jgi:hypothetical protein
MAAGFISEYSTPGQTDSGMGICIYDDWQKMIPATLLLFPHLTIIHQLQKV